MNQDLKDLSENFFQACYHLKDHIKHDPILPAQITDQVENYINRSKYLRICADICNKVKHSKLSKPRESSDTFKNISTHYHLDFRSRPKKDYTLMVTSNNSEINAFFLSKECIKSWKIFFKKNFMQY